MGAHVLCHRLDFTRYFPPWNLTKAGCRIGYLRSLRRSFRNMGRSPATGYMGYDCQL